MTLLNAILEEVGPSGLENGLVIWDWNGTLLNDVDHAVAVMNELLREHGAQEIDRARYAQVFDFPVRRYYDALGFDYERESFESLCHKFVERFMAGFHNLPLVTDAEPLLHELHSRGIKQAVLSATDQTNLDAMIEHYQLKSIFEGVYGIEDKFAASKVERGRELMRKFGADPKHTVIVGDTTHDLEVAEALGIRAILVSHGHQCGTRLRARHHKVIGQE